MSPLGKKLPAESELAALIDALRAADLQVRPDSNGFNACIHLDLSKINEDGRSWITTTFGDLENKSRIVLRDNQGAPIQFGSEEDAQSELDRLNSKSLIRKLLYAIYRETGTALKEPEYSIVKIVG